ncbi:hypothetical protein AB6A40_000719 [Gnathostoma spinigerum]|uniref:PPM-type phosphatase domain-containing protein n=1 Tax=Gnathostoma spinigerum TaxID=75299 RepID=A0ABD6ECH8_9BILA
MLSKVRSAVAARTTNVSDAEHFSEYFMQVPPKVGMVIDICDVKFTRNRTPAGLIKMRFPYSRPEFLYFTDEEIALSADQTTRPVLCPKNPSRMPIYAGYAEVINSGKTEQNEDQATARILKIVQQGTEAEEARELDSITNGGGRSNRHGRATSEVRHSQPKHQMNRRHSVEELITLPEKDTSMDDCTVTDKAEAIVFAIFDGHAGSGAAIMAANCLHEHIKARLSQILETVVHLDRQELFFDGCSQMASINETFGVKPHSICSDITRDQLVIGALETAFMDIDEQIAEERQLWKIPGGCAVIVALFFLGKVYVANAGDCRCLLVTSTMIQPLSQDFTPATERKRLQFIAYKNPSIIGNYFSRLEYGRFLTRRDLKKKVFYRDWYMDGWALKTVRESDLKPPLISDHVKKRRLLNTIGVSRAIGDHHLLTADEKIPIKPFLSSVPEVRVVDLHKLGSVSDNDVLILASDGLWDVLSNDDVARIVKSALNNTEADDIMRYTIAAQELVIAARGNPTDSHRWQMTSGSCASVDDISVFVIPIKHALARPLIGNEDYAEIVR